jgi:hypothetical protein
MSEATSAAPLTVVLVHVPCWAVVATVTRRRART